MSLRILILGGTGNIGPYHVHAAVSRGHRVSVFSRGKRPAEFPAEVEMLTGDLNGDLDSIKNRDWDAVLDVASFGPIWARKMGEALKNRVGHYTLISTDSVYDDPQANAGGAHEESRLVEYRGTEDPYSIVEFREVDEYRALKVLCERESERQFAGRTLIVRPTFIVGPSTAELTYWPVRMQRGGEMLVAGDPLAPVQMIDVRDMAGWILSMIERRQRGVFNIVGPAAPMGFAEMLGAIRGTTSAPVSLVWVPQTWLEQQNVPPVWSSPLMWVKEAGIPGLMRVSNGKAVAHGLEFRPLAVTAADSLSWYERHPPDRKPPLQGLHGVGTIEESMALERELLRKWHALHGA
ncbi:MAG TPA: NAD-dependent epimerase/dehydratase family protein [Steroidobacteraceae bacterium]|jgi:2'-hydroxyisoflavone reductase|nr:NAD-dependent epimerase/dehydratase family protein [Steroidobacteraceae bacterium]